MPRRLIVFWWCFLAVSLGNAPCHAQQAATRAAIEKAGGTYVAARQAGGPYFTPYTMHYLDFSNKPLTDPQLSELVPRLASLNEGIALKLCGTPVTDTGFASLVRLKKLQSVDVSKARVTPAGIKELRQSLQDLAVIDNSGPGAVYPPGVQTFRPWEPTPQEIPGCDDLMWSHDGKKLAVLSSCKTEIWEAATTRLALVLPGGKTGAFSADDKYFSAVSNSRNGNNVVRVWNLVNQAELFAHASLWRPLNIAFDQKGKSLFVHGFLSGDNVEEHNLPLKSLVNNHSGILLGRSQNLAGLQNAERLAALIDPDGNSKTVKVAGLPTQTRFTILSGDGQRLAWAKDPAYDGMADYQIRIVDLKTGNVIRQIQQPSKDVLLHGCFDAQRQRLAFAGDHSAWVYDVATGKQLFTASDPAGLSTRVELSPDGKRVAACFGYASVKWWEIK